jgi:hypothetical protein
MHPAARAALSNLLSHVERLTAEYALCRAALTDECKKNIALTKEIGQREVAPAEAIGEIEIAKCALEEVAYHTTLESAAPSISAAHAGIEAALAILAKVADGGER